jgi:PAS domain S-box-containing protein
MPKLNGMEMIQEIRKINLNIPIIIISAYSDIKLLHESINYGVDGYVLKPISIKELSKTILTIKKKLKAEYLLKQYQNITDESTIISKTNKDGILTYVNENFCKISGYTKEELIGQNHNIIKSKYESNQLFRMLWLRISKRKKIWKGILTNQNKQGKIYYVQTTIKPIINFNGEIEEFIALSIPITNIIHPEKQLNDFLKPLKNPIVILIKIEEFKYLNTSLTNKISNRLQKIFAKELFKHMPSSCHFSKVYLLDNGEFVFVKKQFTQTEYNHFYKEIKNFQKEVNHAKIQIGLVDYTLSILVSLAFGENALENAKVGMRKLLKGQQEFIVANELLEKEKSHAIEKLKTFKMLKTALDSYNIISYFQPIVNNKTKEIEKYESLVRLIDEKQNIISPYFFLDTAKEGKYYHQITSIVLQNSFKALYETNMNISINLSALDIEKRETKAEFFSLLQKHKSQTHRIVVELLEDENIKNVRIIKEFMVEIKKFNVKIAIDDFGSGLSNFSRVLQYQPDFIKIDGTLIKDIEDNQFSRNMVETIVNFSKKQNIKTIAEYVENENIFNILCDIGVDYSQGYYFGKPSSLLKES